MQTYLRYWAAQLDCPVISVEYSLAPENPYPRPTEECLYAYAWALNHAAELGWTGGRIVLVGDSAGGNLIMSMTLRAISMRIRRMPNGTRPCVVP